MLIRRETNTGSNSLLTVYRPCTIKELFGNEKLKSLLTGYLEKETLPHGIIFSGVAGTGKTTLARTLALSLNCLNPNGIDPCLECEVCKATLNHNNIDVTEINVGTSGGKAAVEDIIDRLASSPFNSNYKVLIFDEAHRLTDAAKALLLKPIEDCYGHVFLFFCTNEPDKLYGKNKEDNPFIDRCSELHLDRLSEDETYDILINVSQFEGAPYKEEVIQYITDNVKGVPRKALKSLEVVINEGSWDLNNVKSLLGDVIVDENDTEIIELSRTLFKGDFKNSCKVFEKLVKKYPVESIRVAVTGYFVACLKKSGGKVGIPISNSLTHLTTPIYLTGKPSEHIFYNLMFKVTTFMRG